MTADVKHVIRWFARIEPSPENPEGLIPRTTIMADGAWGWDVRCSCGWETRTGGGTAASIRQEVWFHKWQAIHGRLEVSP